MDVGSLAQRLGIRDPQLIAKGKELLRLSSLKVPGGLGQGEVCKASVCLELACSTTAHVQAPSRDDFIRHSCATRKVYTQAYVMLQKALGVTSSMGIPQLVVKFGVEPLAKPAEALLGLYRARFLMDVRSHLPSSACQAADGASSKKAISAAGANPAAPIVDFSHPVFAVAALHLTALRASDMSDAKGGRKRALVKLQVPKVLKALDISSAHFQHTVDSMQQLCAVELGLQKTHDKEEDTSTEQPATAAASCADAAPAKRGRGKRQAPTREDADDAAQPKKPRKKGLSYRNNKASASRSLGQCDDSGIDDDDWQVVG